MRKLYQQRIAAGLTAHGKPRKTRGRKSQTGLHAEMEGDKGKS